MRCCLSKTSIQQKLLWIWRKVPRKWFICSHPPLHWFFGPKWVICWCCTAFLVSGWLMPTWLATWHSLSHTASFISACLNLFWYLCSASIPFDKQFTHWEMSGLKKALKWKLDLSGDPWWIEKDSVSHSTAWASLLWRKVIHIEQMIVTFLLDLRTKGGTRCCLSRYFYLYMRLIFLSQWKVKAVRGKKMSSGSQYQDYNGFRIQVLISDGSRESLRWVKRYRNQRFNEFRKYIEWNPELKADLTMDLGIQIQMQPRGSLC